MFSKNLLLLASIFVGGIPSLASTADETTIFVSLISFEGFRLTPYKEKGCSSWSVGIGHNLTAHKQRIKEYTQKEVMEFFHEDYLEALSTARRLVRDFDNLPEPAQIVVIQLIWSVGPTGFYKFKKFRMALNNKSWVTARKELLNSKWAGQVQKERVEWAIKLLKGLDA
jgi:GH24 family phage-related lysozyme (muramidase)